MAKIPIPKELIEKYLSEEEVTEAIASLGENRGQFFVRIPVKISERLNLQETDKIKFVVRGKGSNFKLEVEVVKDGSA